MNRSFQVLLLIILALGISSLSLAVELEPIRYNHPGLAVDLGVGLWAWPLPMDYDGDGDLDLVVSCPDKPYNGLYFFENPSGEKLPVFKPGVRVGPALSNAQLSVVDGQPRILSPAQEWMGIHKGETPKAVSLYKQTNLLPKSGRIRANQWRRVDYDGDGALDLIVGAEDWSDYGWDDAFDAEGHWTHGPLHGLVFFIRNKGTTERPDYEPPRQVEADGKPVDGFGMPSPNFADFDGDGDLDLICGEFLNGFTWYENVGGRTSPTYAAGRRLTTEGKPLTMNLQMITPNAVDWDRDGDIDLVVGDEDGRVALIEQTGRMQDGLPQFLPPCYFQQEAHEVKFGALVTPVSFDWDGDGDEDLICGNTSGVIGFIENLDSGDPPRWAAPRLLEAGGKPFRIQAGPNGSIQGPAEAKWGYTTLSVADWDGDSLPDLVVNSIWGKVIWLRNIGSRREPRLDAPQPIEVAWEGAPTKPAWNWWTPQGNELATQWRTTPFAADLNGDGLCDLAMLDHEGYFAFYERKRHGESLILLPPRRVFTDASGAPLRLNEGRAGKSGRRKLCLGDWDGDGKLDLLLNSVNVDFYKNTSTNERPWSFANQGPLHERILAGHDTSPTFVDWNRDGIRDLLIGAEDGRFYYLANPRAAKK